MWGLNVQDKVCPTPLFGGFSFFKNHLIVVLISGGKCESVL